MESETVLYHSAAGIGRLTLNRPARLNAFTQPMHAAMRDAMTRIENDKSLRCLVVTGAGRAFCSGQDINERRLPPGAPPLDLGPGLDANFNALIRRMRALPVPIIGAVNGVAAGAGVSVALACDIVVAARAASFNLSFARIGLSLDAGVSWILPRLIGPAYAIGMAMLAQTVDAERAASWGLIWKAVDDADLNAEVNASTAELTAKAPQALAAIKRGLQASWINTLDQQLDLERDAQQALGRGGDYREGVNAFFEKRPPQFRGARASLEDRN